MKIKTLSAVLAWLLISAGLGVGVVSLITVDKVGHASRAWEAFDKGAATKAVILSDLRGALGYGGMIHHFKDLVLRKDRIEIVNIQDELRQVAIALVRYESLGVTETEKLALERIDNVVMRYSNFVAVVEDLAANGAASSEIDAVVKVDDRAALEAIRDLQSELLAVRKVSGDQVYESVSTVSNLVTVSAIGLTFLLLVVIVGFNYFLRKRLTGPLAKLGQAMEALADGDFAIVVPFTGRGDEIGAMAGTVEVFKNNAIERQNEKAELQESEQRVRTFFDTITDGIITIDPGGIIRSANPAVLRQFGYDIKEILGQSVNILMPEEIAREHDRHFSGYLQSNISNAIGLPREVTGRRKDGSTFPLELAVSEIIIDGAPIFTSHIRDITERKNAEAEREELERELSQAQRLESLGTLAGGIAHEINTPVQYIGDNTRFLKIAFSDLSLVLQKHMTLLEAASDSGVLTDAVADASAAVEDKDPSNLLEEIPGAIKHSLEGLEQIAEIVKAIKEFSYPNTKEKNPTDINQAIMTTITVSRNQWKYAAELETDLCATLPLVPCLPGELNQVFLNLIVNAAHAIEDSGNESKGQIAISTRRNGNWAEIRIGDTGSGIPEENRDKIFEPFFTTKEPGRGTGQGLAISHTIITKKHGGTLTFNSEVGKGTAFIIRPPLVGHDQSEVAA